MQHFDRNSTRSAGPPDNGGHVEPASGDINPPDNHSPGSSAVPPPDGGPPRSPSGASPGGFGPSDDNYPVLSKNEPNVQADPDFILTAAWNGSGEDVVTAYHLAKFGAESGGDEHVLGQIVRDMEANLASGVGHRRQLEALLANTRRYDEELLDSKPWTLWDGIQLAAMFTLSLLLLGVDVNSTAVTLMHSGWDSFRAHYWVSALFNLGLIIGGAFVIKLVDAWIVSERVRRCYALGVAFAAFASLAIALPAFAATYARMSVDPIALMTGEAGAGQAPDASRTYLFQIVTGNLIAGAAWLTASFLISQHRRSARAENAAWARVKADLDRTKEVLEKEGKKLALVRARLAQIDADRNKLLIGAAELYKLAAGEAENARQQEVRRTEFLRQKPTLKKTIGTKVLFVPVALALALHSLAQERAPETGGRHYVIAVGAGLPKETGTNVLRASFNLLLNQARAGDKIEFIDAQALTRLAVVSVPPGSARDRAGSPEFNGKFGALKKFLVESAPVEPAMRGQLHLPQLLDDVAANRAKNEQTVLILVGSPLFMSRHPTEQAFNMDAALVPDDGMISASVAKSIFGTKERRGQLQGVVIHWYTPDDRWIASDMHRQRVERFWTLVFGQEEAVQSTFGSDLGLVFDRAERGDRQPVTVATLDPNDQGLSMHQAPGFRRDWIADPAVPPVGMPPAKDLEPSAPQPPISPASPWSAPAPAPATPPAKPVSSLSPAPSPGESSPATNTATATIPPITSPPPPALPVIPEMPRASAGSIGVAAVWQVAGEAATGADIDLHVSAGPGLPEVSWRRGRAEGARYYRDIRHASLTNRDSKAWQVAWEYVEVSHSELRNVTVWLNVYHTSAPITGVVRIQWQGQTVDRPFAFKVTRGNGGRESDPESRRRSAYWQEVPLADLFPAMVSRKEK